MAILGIRPADPTRKTDPVRQSVEQLKAAAQNVGSVVPTVPTLTPAPVSFLGEMVDAMDLTSVLGGGNLVILVKDK